MSCAIIVATAIAAPSCLNRPPTYAARSAPGAAMHSTTGTAASFVKMSYRLGEQTGGFADGQSAGGNIAKTGCCLSRQNRKGAQILPAHI
jgi:hypothetical protein